nr:Gag-Pol polyprotein [Tanacetum cinerariifolium]
MQTQTYNTLHNAIMEAGSKDHPPMLAPVDACPNACEMWKVIERLKQGESINVQDLETNLYWEFGKFTSQDGESLESYYSRIGNVAGARETVGSTVVQKSRIQCYNCKEFGHVAMECQKLKRVKDAAYHREKMLLCKQEEARIQLNAKQADWRDDTDDDELEDQEREAHYMYMAQLQEVSLDAADSGPIFDAEPLQKNDDDNDLSKERELLASLIEKLKCEIDESKNRNKFLETSNKVLIEKVKDAQNVLIESDNMNYDSEQIDEYVDLAKERSPDIRTGTRMETYKTVSQDIRDQLNAEAEAVQIILTRIDNDIYLTVDACPNACEM